MESLTITPGAPENVGHEWKAYVQSLCHRSGIPLEQVPLEQFSACKTKTEVNKVLFMEIMPSIIKQPFTGFPDDMAEFLSGNRFGFNAMEYNRIKRDRDNTARRLRERRNAYQLELENLAAYEDKLLELIFVDRTEELAADLRKIAEGNTWEFVSFIASNGAIEFKARNDVIVTHKLSQAGIDMQVNFGRMRAVYYPKNGRILVHPAADGCVSLDDGYFHPHVDSSDYFVCWGNAESTYETCMRNRTPAKAFDALWLLLNTYNATSPYRKLFDFYRKQNPDSALKVPFLYALTGPSVWVSETFKDEHMPEYWAENAYDSRYNEDTDEREYCYRTRRKVEPGSSNRVDNGFYLAEDDAGTELFEIPFDEIVEED